MKPTLVPGFAALLERRANAAALEGGRLFRYWPDMQRETFYDAIGFIKTYASAHDLLVMGPDCGTSLIGGKGIGFANVVRRGSIGAIGAAGNEAAPIAAVASGAAIGPESSLFSA